MAEPVLPKARDVRPNNGDRCRQRVPGAVREGDRIGEVGHLVELEAACFVSRSAAGQAYVAAAGDAGELKGWVVG